MRSSEASTARRDPPDDLSVVGVDFTSAPSVSKPITVAIGTLSRAGPQPVYVLDEVLALSTFDTFEAFLRESGPWIGGFDLPFGQPRDLIEHERWPTDWRAFVEFFCGESRARLRDTFRRWCDARPTGDKFAWRKADKPAGSSPAMRWTNPPVAWMMHAGIKRMVDAGLAFPAHEHPRQSPARRPGTSAAAVGAGRATATSILDDARIALESYPGFTARKVVRASYKSDSPSKQTAERARSRRRILQALIEGTAGLDLGLRIGRAWSQRLLEDGSGDLIDAVISAMQAAHAAMLPGYGLPAELDPLEGWIAAVPPPVVPARGDQRRHHTRGDRDHPVVQPLLEWFDRAKRDLPWRRNRDPYRVWVSEIMLQQTQVERVKEFFSRFMARFPEIGTLAGADEADVLAHWEGLGYYRRARQLHAAAKKIVAEHAGVFPCEIEALRRLPGVGRYTARAIASIAMDLPEPIVEANSRRVIARLVGHAKRLDGPGGDEPIWKAAAQMVPGKHAGRFNQALMDLGATVCTPTRPLCTACPVAGLCVARRTKRVAMIPAKLVRKKMVERREAALVARRAGRVLVVKRGDGEWWAGLWDFPRVGVRSKKAAAALGSHLGTIRHSVTHHRITLEVVLVATSALPKEISAARGGGKKALQERRWMSLSGLTALAMPSPARRIVRMLAGTKLLVQSPAPRSEPL